MDSPRGSALSSSEAEDDFLSRHVNLGWDADSTDWNHREDSSDILTNDYCDLLKLFSREHSREQIFEDMNNPRKSSLEKPVGLLMQLKPRVYVCENFKSSRWGKYLSANETKACEASQGLYHKEHADSNNNINIEETKDSSDKHHSKRNSVHSAFRRSKSVNDVQDSARFEASDSVDKQHRDGPQKEEKEEENTCQNKRVSANKLTKQFSVYRQNFDLNSRFISKSHYHMNYWKPETSLAGRRAQKNRESLTNSKEPILDVLIEKKITRNKENEKKDSEIEEIRRRFNTEKNFRSWVWEPEFNLLNQRKTTQNGRTKSVKIPIASEHQNKVKSHKITKKEKRIGDPTCKSSPGSNTLAFPAILTRNASPSRRQKCPHKLGHFPCISTDNLMHQYKKYHEEFLKQTNKKIE